MVIHYNHLEFCQRRIMIIQPKGSRLHRGICRFQLQIGEFRLRTRCEPSASISAGSRVMVVLPAEWGALIPA